ncbi:acetyltransferase [Mariprofundus erugo]|uniref:Acetyltransferase n=1 Tax=Mariprofundus erugo TaxID=2528639 RepID=A0A5R9GW79_9PROT|nr:acetyltransferase [Mariprofundus erugo]TLS68989.1 acetyltransferase [Mariprofundus erugo]
MYLRNAKSSDLAHVMELSELTDPNSATVRVRFHAGEEAGEPVSIQKSELSFASGEALPKCWLDPHYRVSF